jgi:hypothetical protein
MVCGAHERNRTFDLLLTKEVLYRLSYVSVKRFLLPDMTQTLR